VKRLRPDLRLVVYSIPGRLVLTYLLIGALTLSIGFALLVVGSVINAVLFTPRDYKGVIENAIVQWFIPDSTFAATAREDALRQIVPQGYTLLIGPDQRVVLAEGDSPCAVGDLLSACAPDWTDLTPHERFIRRENEPNPDWVEAVMRLPTGEVAVARQARPTVPNLLAWLVTNVPSFIGGLAQGLLLVAFLSVPICLVVIILVTRPLVQRISRIVSVSQRVTAGDLAARLTDSRPDELGQLAQQFNAMADALQQNIFVLRDLLRANADVAIQAETVAAQSERLRLARNLHDDLSQRLFSLNLTAGALPNLIATDPAAALTEARRMAELTDQTQLRLRTLLIELRPGGILDTSLAGSLRALCLEWAAHNHIAPDLSIMLSADQFPVPLQTAIYQITQESLNNIAKHAAATHVAISLVQGRHQMVLSVSDDGRGFTRPLNGKEGPLGGHYGLVSMRERAESLGGTVTIESEPGRGTTVRAVLPINAEAPP
jgi:signal transduction histidine kinase